MRLRRTGRRGDRRARYPFDAPARMVVFSLLTLAVIMSLGGIKGSEPETVYAQSGPVTFLVQTSDLIPTATPTTVAAPTATLTTVPAPTATPRPASRLALGSITTASAVDLTTDGIISLIRKYFPKDARTAKAVFRAESGLSPTAKNWNCHYWENGRRVSRTCRVEDRGRAWSVDCGLTQINQAGTECPRELFEVETNLKRARAKYEAKLKMGLDPWSPWSAYLQGSYKQFLD